MKKLLLLSILLSSVAHAGDCRARVTTTYNLINFAAVDTIKATQDLTDYLAKKNHFIISGETDTPYVIDYVLTADGSQGRYMAGSIKFVSKGVKYTDSFSSGINIARVSRQVPAFNDLMEAAKRATSSCPDYNR